jgi:predicted nucleic acid-binding protein
MIWILDASVAIRWFLIEEAHPAAEAVLQEVIDKPELFAVPESFFFETFSVLNRIHPQGASIFREGLLPLLYSGILRHPFTESLAIQAESFLAKGLAGYDACYAALARELSGIWLTYDSKAHRKIQNQKLSHLLSTGLPPTWPYPEI